MLLSVLISSVTKRFKLLAASILKRGYAQVFGYAQAFESPTGATYRFLSMTRGFDAQLGLRPGDLLSQTRLHTGVCIPQTGELEDILPPSPSAMSSALDVLPLA